MTTLTQPTNVKGHALSGFSNLLGKELRAFWGTRTWWINLLVYLLLINGLTALATFAGEAEGMPIAERYMMFPVFHLIFAGGGTILAAQGLIVKEKEMGTAAWVLSKPVSRPAFLLAKFVAIAFNFLIVAVLVPSVFTYITWQFAGIVPDVADMALAALGLFLVLLFYQGWTLMVGTFLDSRTATAGLGFLMLYLQTQLGQGALGAYMPAGISFQMPTLFIGEGLTAALPYATTLIAVVLFALIAIWRFGRSEF